MEPPEMMDVLMTMRAGTDRHGQPIEVLEQGYVGFFNALGVRVHPVSSFDAFLDEYSKDGRYKALVITGGGDVSPAFGGGGSRGPADYCEDRDRSCVRLIEAFTASGRPVLGICYGMQLLNCHLGGQLDQDIHRAERAVRSPRSEHAVGIELAVFGLSGRKMVNHYHNHGLRRAHVAPGFEVFAVDAEYDVVEGVLHRELPVLGVQWHPERPSPDEALNEQLVRGFLGL
jgi:putative glutamine amidotransferase